jgi:chromosome segregation ATPase
LERAGSERKGIGNKNNMLDKEAEAIKEDFKKLEVERRCIHEEDEQIEKDSKEVHAEFDKLNLKQESVQSLNESMEKESHKLKISFEGIHEESVVEESSESLEQVSVRIEEVKVKKEHLIEEEKLAEEENKLLWTEADRLQKKKDDLVGRNAEIDSDNDKVQAKLDADMKERSLIAAKNKDVNENLQAAHERLEQIVKERSELRVVSGQIDTEHHRLKAVLEWIQTSDPGNDVALLGLKKSFVKLQEEKVSLMKTDFVLEKSQYEQQEVFSALKKHSDTITDQLESGADKLNEVIKEFEKLKRLKDDLINEDTELEKESKKLKAKFDANLARKSKLTGDFKKAELQSSVVLEEFESLQVKFSPGKLNQCKIQGYSAQLGGCG